MINVLHLRDTAHVCGPGKTIIESICATDTRDFSQKIGLFLLESERSNRYAEAAARRGIEVVPVRSRHPYDPSLITRLARIIREHNIHIVHSHEYKSDLVAYFVSKVSPVAIVSTVHGWIRTSFKRRLMIGISQKILCRFDRVIAVSTETKRQILACGVADERVVVIHNAIVTGDYRRENHPPGFLRSRFALPPDALLVGSIGRLSPEKGQRDLLEAAAAIVGRVPQAHVLFIGDGPDRAELERQVRTLGLERRILFTGHLPDPRPAYRDLDILALTSHTEGFPNVVLEALCMDVPVLATSVGGTPEIINDGVTGLLVPPGRPEEIAKGLHRLISDPAAAREMARNGKQLVGRRFNFAERVAREADLYRQISPLTRAACVTAGS